MTDQTNQPDPDLDPPPVMPRFAAAPYKGGRSTGEALGILMWDEDKCEGDVLMLPHFDQMEPITRMEAAVHWITVLEHEHSELCDDDDALAELALATPLPPEEVARSAEAMRSIRALTDGQTVTVTIGHDVGAPEGEPTVFEAVYRAAPEPHPEPAAPAPKPMCEYCGENEATFRLAIGGYMMCTPCHAANIENSIADFHARIEIGRRVHKAYAKATGVKRRDADLADLLCDLIHYADAYDLDFHELLMRAYQNANAEKQDRRKAHSGDPIT